MLKTHFGILIKSVSFEQESDTIDEISLWIIFWLITIIEWNKKDTRFDSLVQIISLQCILQWTNIFVVASYCDYGSLHRLFFECEVSSGYICILYLHIVHYTQEIGVLFVHE